MSFDEPSLVSHAGLLPVASLCNALVCRVVAEGLTLPGSVGANSNAKTATEMFGMLAGAGSIEILEVLRSGHRQAAGASGPRTPRQTGAVVRDRCA